MNYWEMCGERSKDFWDGVKTGIDAYAIWKDGEQLVGIGRKPIKEVYAEIDAVAQKDVKENP